MKTAILTKSVLVLAALYLVCPGMSQAEAPEHDITVGRTIHTEKPVCLVYRDDGFWVTQGGTADTLRHYSTDGTLLAEYQLPGSVQRYGVAWDGAHWWIGDNNYGSETIYKCELNEAEKRLEPVRAYGWPYLGPSGLEWAQGYLWVSDDATDIIYRVSVGDTSFTAIEAWCSTNPEPWDLAWDGTNIWSITGPGGGFDSVMGEREIYKHDAAGNIIEIWHYPPADDPGQGSYGGCGTGLAFAGSQLWYCDYDRNQIIEGVRGAGIGLVAYYPFNANANDESGNGNHGSLVGGATWTTGVLDGAVHLDGTGYINVPDSSSLDLPGGRGTIAAFIKVDPSTDEFGVVAKESSSSFCSTLAYEFLVRPDRESSVISDGTTCNYGINSGGADLRDSSWHHVALTWSGPGGEILIYRDGVVVAQADQTISTINNIPEPVLIGAFRWNVPPGILRRMLGELDEVRIYNRALSADEIVELAGITEPGDLKGRIVFVLPSEQKIYVMNADGSSRQQVPLPPLEVVSSPQWSRDGLWLTFCGGEGNNCQIYIVRPDGTGFRRVTNGSGDMVEPGFSPDGLQITFCGPDGTALYIINTDGTDMRQLPVDGSFPEWWPLGDKILYSNWGRTYESDLFLYDLTTGRSTQITHHAPGQAFIRAAWSPNGRRLAVDFRDRNRTGEKSDVLIMTADGSNPSNFTAAWPDSGEGAACWSPDGQFILFVSDRTGNFDIWYSPVDVFSPVNITNSPEDEDTPAMGTIAEAQPVYSVDAVNGDDNNNGLSRRTAFATISKGIDSATNRYKVLVYPGVYREEVDFKGKTITVQGVATEGGIPIIENPGDFAVSFYNGEGPRAILKNFVVRNSFMGIFIAGSSPTIKNLNIVDNKYGIEAYAGSEPDISNCIFWENSDSDLFGCEARYSCTSEPGQGNIAADPCFVDPNNGEYHLLSERGRYWPRADVWVLDKVTSPCIDGGDPYDDPSDEPMPNGGRIDMGSFGGTPFASMSEWELKGDINRDGSVNMTDFSIFAEYWLQTSLRAREIDNRLACATNLRSLGRALLIYTNDYDDEFPTADQWCDLLLQRESDRVTEEMFVCPSAEGGPSHYAINPNAKGWSHGDMVLLFETMAGWNQFRGPELLAPQNHQGQGCNILFVDGHVEFVQSERLDDLRWE